MSGRAVEKPRSAATVPDLSRMYNFVCNILRILLLPYLGV